MSEHVESWRELAADIRQRAKNALEHGEERVTSCEAIGNLLTDIADRVRAIGERMEVGGHSVDAATLAFIGAKDALIGKMRLAFEDIKKEAKIGAESVHIGSLTNGRFMSIYGSAHRALLEIGSRKEGAK